MSEDKKDVSTEDLNTALNTTLSAIGRVADLANKTWPDAAPQLKLKETAEVLRSHVSILKAKADKADTDYLLDKQTDSEDVTLDALSKVARKECLDAFNRIKDAISAVDGHKDLFEADTAELSIKKLDIYLKHARHLYEIILKDK